MFNKCKYAQKNKADALSPALSLIQFIIRRIMVSRSVVPAVSWSIGRSCPPYHGHSVGNPALSFI